MLERLLLAYSSGLLAAVSPCVLVLIPLCLVRFVQPSGGAAKASSSALCVQLLQFLVGFQLSYLVFGFALAEVLTSRIQIGVKLALGLLFLVSSVLAARGHIDPLRLPMVESAWATGASFALLLSVNPCTVPFLALLISMSSSAPVAHTVLALLSFGQGLITPALAVVLAGQKMMRGLENAAWKMERLKSSMFVLLGASGLYLLASEVHIVAGGDLAVASAGLVAAIALLHHAAQKPPMQMPSFDAAWPATPPVPPPPPPPSSLLAPTLASTVLVLLLLASTAVYDHNPATHAAIDAAYADAQQKVQSQPTESLIQLQAASSPVLAPEAEVGTEARGPFRQLKRQLTGAANGNGNGHGRDSSAVGPSDGGSVPGGGPLDPVFEVEYHHLDADALEAPSIVPAAPIASAHAEHAQHGHESRLDVHASMELSQVDLDALASLSQQQQRQQQQQQGEAEDSSRCVDLSMVPPCPSCQLTTWSYRLLALALAFAALFTDQMSQATWPLDSRASTHTPGTPASFLERPRAAWSVFARMVAPQAPHKEQTLTL